MLPIQTYGDRDLLPGHRDALVGDGREKMIELFESGGVDDEGPAESQLLSALDRKERCATGESLSSHLMPIPIFSERILLQLQIGRYVVPGGAVAGASTGIGAGAVEQVGREQDDGAPGTD